MMFVDSSNNIRTGSTLRDQRRSESFMTEPNSNSIFIKILKDYRHCSTEKQSVFLDKINGLELLKALQTMKNDLASMKLENLVLSDFLGNYDMNFAIYLNDKQPKWTYSHTNRLIQQAQQSKLSSFESTLYSSRQSGRSRLQMDRRLGFDHHLNYKAKAEMTEKSVSEMETHIVKCEKSAMKELIALHAMIEQLKYGYADAKETLNNFKLHFLRDENDLHFLETATERQIEHKLRKFMQNWFKNAGVLRDSMRLTITSLQDKCHQHRIDMQTKSELHSVLKFVDFENLMTKCNAHLNTIEQIRIHLVNLKFITGKAGLAISTQKQVMMTLEYKLKDFSNKIKDAGHYIENLEKEMQFVIKENIKDRRRLERLKQKLENYNAPNIVDYIGKKDEFIQLEKEEKILRRKTSILKMKLRNLRSTPTEQNSRNSKIK